MRITIVLLSAFVLIALVFQWANPLAPGTWHGRQGIDFYGVPNGFLHLIHEESMFRLDNRYPVPHVTQFVYHPLLAVTVGAWAALLPPLVAYWTFTLFSIALLIGCATALARLFTRRSEHLAIFLFFLGSVPTYLLLWNAQMHIFLVVSLTCVLLSIITQIQRPTNTAWSPLLAAGILLSLFTKPLILLFLPLLLLVRETRATTLFSIGAYALISSVFLFVPALNPVGDNAFHWVNIVTQAHEIPLQNFELFSLPALLVDAGFFIHPLVYQLPFFFLLLLCPLILLVRSAQQRLMCAILFICVLSASYYLSYTLIWEYQYTTLLPVIVVLWYLIQKMTQRSQRTLLSALLFFVALLLFLPTPCGFFKESILEHLFICRITRVGDAALLYSGIVIALLIQLYRGLRSANVMPNELPSQNALDHAAVVHPEKKE